MCENGQIVWERIEDMAQMYCTSCETTWYIPQCCKNEKCGGCKWE